MCRPLSIEVRSRRCQSGFVADHGKHRISVKRCPVPGRQPKGGCKGSSDTLPRCEQANASCCCDLSKSKPHPRPNVKKSGGKKISNLSSFRFERAYMATLHSLCETCQDAEPWWLRRARTYRFLRRGLVLLPGSSCVRVCREATVGFGPYGQPRFRPAGLRSC